MGRAGVPALLILTLAACRHGPAGEAAVTPGQPTGLTGEARAELVQTIRQRTAERIVTLLESEYVFAGRHAETIGRIAAGLRQAAAGATADGDGSAWEAAVRESLGQLPPGSVGWLSRAERVAQESEDPTVYEGIGTYIAHRSAPLARVILLEVMPGSPAEKAGLRAHDAILAVDDGAVRADEAETVTARIRGAAGSSVKLLVRSPLAQPREIRVTRGTVDLAGDWGGLRSFVLPGTRVGYLAFPRGAEEDLADRVRAALDDMEPLAGLVLDLRIATADSQWPLAALAALFAAGELGSFRGIGQVEPLTVEAAGRPGWQEVALAVLVGPDTGGLAEIFAAVLRDCGRATLVGAPTPGAIEAIRSFALPDGSRLAVAASSFVTAAGTDVGLDGLAPGVAVSADWDTVSDARDPVRDAAVAALARSAARGKR